MKKEPMLKNIPMWVFIVAGFVALVVLWSVVSLRRQSYPQNRRSEATTMQIEMVRRKIDGVLVPKGTVEVLPVAVVIDNLEEARPPSGLAAANLVWEAPAEANITRLVAVYGDGSEVSKIGPVRSLRPYFLDFALEVDALLAHVGGSPEALQIAGSRRAKHLDEFGLGKYFWRDNSRPRPHNVYTSTELLRQALDVFSPPDKGELEGVMTTYNSWPYKDDTPSGEVDEFSIDFGRLDNRVTWKYDAASNDYVRFQAGEKHGDEDGAVIRSKNVAVMATKIVILDEVGRRRITTVGEGDALVFRDGASLRGTWKRSSLGARTRFYDEAGIEIALNAGTAWIQVVRDVDQITIIPTSRQDQPR